VRIARKAKFILSATLLSVIAAPPVTPWTSQSPPRQQGSNPRDLPLHNPLTTPSCSWLLANNPDWSLRIGLKGPGASGPAELTRLSLWSRPT